MTAAAKIIQELSIPGFDGAEIAISFQSPQVGDKVYETLEKVYDTDWLRKDKHDIVRHWQGHIFRDEDGNHHHSSTAYQFNAKGTKTKPITQRPTLVKIKNVGRSNQTTSQGQALSEILSKRKEQYDDNYRPEGDATPLKTLPMLADHYKDRKHTVKFPVVCQEKFDGMRRVHGSQVAHAPGGVSEHSRGGIALDTQVVSHLNVLTHGYELDGEIILPAPDKFQQTIKACKKFYPDKTPQLLYRVYDVVSPLPYWTLDGSPSRYELIKQIIAGAGPNVVVAESRVCENEEEVFAFFDEIVAEGGEGIIIRSMDGPYIDDKRVDQLLKLKKQDDKEYRIVDVISGERGEAADQAILVCESEDGRRFNVTPKKTHAERRRMLREKDEVIGQVWKVVFGEYTDEGLPRHGVGIGVREVALEGKGSIS